MKSPICQNDIERLNPSGVCQNGTPEIRGSGDNYAKMAL